MKPARCFAGVSLGIGEGTCSTPVIVEHRCALQMVYLLSAFTSWANIPYPLSPPCNAVFRVQRSYMQSSCMLIVWEKETSYNQPNTLSPSSNAHTIVVGSLRDVLVCRSVRMSRHAVKALTIVNPPCF